MMDRPSEVKLTKAQRSWLSDIAATQYGMLPVTAIAVGQGGSLASLVKRGLLEYRGSLYRITDAGRSALSTGAREGGE